VLLQVIVEGSNHFFTINSVSRKRRFNYETYRERNELELFT